MARPKTISDSTLIEVVERVLLRLGPARFTLADVAKEVGLSPATLVQRYGSKRGLILAFSRATVARAADPFRLARSQTQSPTAALLRALTYATHAFDSRQAVVNGLYALIADLEDPELLALAQAHADAMQNAIGALLDEATATGELRRTDTKALSLSVQAAYNGAVLQWGLRGTGNFEDYLRAVLQPLLPLVVPLTREITKGPHHEQTSRLHRRFPRWVHRWTQRRTGLAAWAQRHRGHLHALHGANRRVTHGKTHLRRGV
jgi:AcrR family transcriptional regulator